MSKRHLIYLVLLALAAGSCYLRPEESPDATAIDPARTDPNDPVPACTATCENHLGSICASASDGGLCTCAPRGNSGKGRWDCVPDWQNRGAACAPGAEHGTGCPRVIDAIAQACAVPARQQACFCNQGRTWRCAVLGK